MEIFTQMLGTLAVILVVAGFIGGSELMNKFMGEQRSWKYVILAGILGGLFGIYGNLAGVNYNGAVISVRDIGPMLAGFIGGPVGGIIAGAICGIHRYFMGGITAGACIIATCLIGLICGFLSRRYHTRLLKAYVALTVGAAMVILHLGIVLIMVRPFETAWDIVKHIAIPFIAVNAVGFTLLITIMGFMERQRSLMLERSRLQSELDVANVIQHSLLPPINSSYPGRDEFCISASMEAAKNVGGDFYDFFFVNQDKMAFLIADVSGKGVPAAMFMANAKITLQNAIRDFGDLTEAVRKANEGLCINNEAEMFVTAWIGVLDIKNYTVEFVNAGHNPPILISGNSAEYVRAKGGFVLAGMEGSKYRLNLLTLNPGDTLFLYTDGVTEAENSAHALYGEERLLNCISANTDASPDALTELVRTDIASFVNGFTQSDDLTMLCIKMK